MEKETFIFYLVASPERDIPEASGGHFLFQTCRKPKLYKKNQSLKTESWWRWQIIPLPATFSSLLNSSNFIILIGQDRKLC